MHVTVNKELWLVFIQYLIEAFKACMGQVLTVVKLIGRRMCDQYVHALTLPELTLHLPDSACHLALGKLIGGFVAEIVFHTAAKSHDPHTVMNVNSIFYRYAALRRNTVVFIIMIPVNIKHGAFCIGYQERQIVRIQVTCRDYKIYPLQLALLEEIPLIFRFNISYR